MRNFKNSGMKEFKKKEKEKENKCISEMMIKLEGTQNKQNKL